MSYPPIAEHGLIGDLQTAHSSRPTAPSTGSVVRVLIHRACSAPCSMMRRAGGSRSPRPTNASRSRCTCPTRQYSSRGSSPRVGVAELIDFMPIENPHTATNRHRLVRGIRGVRGKVDFELRIEPRFDYGRQSHRTEVDGTNARFETSALTLDVTSTWPLEQHDGDIRARFTVEAGDLCGVVLESGADGHPTVFGGEPSPSCSMTP